MADGPSGFGQCSLSLFQFMFHSRHVYGAHKCYQPFHTIAAISHTSAHQDRPDGQWKTPPFLLRQMLIPQLAQLAQLRTHKPADTAICPAQLFFSHKRKTTHTTKDMSLPPQMSSVPQTSRNVAAIAENCGIGLVAQHFQSRHPLQQQHH